MPPDERRLLRYSFKAHQRPGIGGRKTSGSNRRLRKGTGLGGSVVVGVSVAVTVGWGGVEDGTGDHVGSTGGVGNGETRTAYR